MKKLILLALKSTYLLRRPLNQQGYDVLEAQNLNELQQALLNRDVSLVLLDADLPDGEGEADDLAALRWLRQRAPDVPVITVGPTGRLDVMRDAQLLGSIEHLMRPLDTQNVVSLVRSTTELSQIIRQNVASQATGERDLPGLNRIIGSSALIAGIKTTIRQVAPHRSAVMILGESGTGKEMAARAIHDASPRRDGPFIAINCISIPEGIAESLLFGHKKGAFTGASEDRVGMIAQADGGTLFLDEIGDMPIEVQGKLLRVLDQRRVAALGSKVEEEVDFRIICATNADLQQLIQDGRFRQDLFFRLRVSVVQMPPLRQRPSDIPLLVRHFVREAVGYDLTLDPETERALAAYPWPGNVRELSNAVESARITCGARLRDIGEALRRYCAQQRPMAAAPEVSAAAAPPERDVVHQLDHLLSELIERREQITEDNLARWLEGRLVQVALDQTDNNKSRAARLIGMNRRALQRRVQRTQNDSELS